jgi:hypothetical protein
MFVLFRALVFAVIFMGFVLVLVPARILSAAGIAAPAAIGRWQIAGMLVGGAALYYQSMMLFGYATLFWSFTAVFVLAYEEPTLTRTFGDDYTAYCARVGRWWPRQPVKQAG